MPYDIVKVGRDGFRVCKPDSSKCFSKKTLTLTQAKKQQRALYASEQDKRSKKIKKLETQPTGKFRAIISANAAGEGSPKLTFTGEKRDVANYVARFTKQEPNLILQRITDKGVSTFGQPIIAVVTPETMTGAGIFDWLKKTAGKVGQAVKSGLSQVINNISNDTPATTELGDNFMKAQTKIFSPSGQEDEPGIPPQQVIQNFQPNQYMPSTKVLFQMNKNAYDNSTASVDPGWQYMTGTPTLKLYNNGPAIVVAVRGTADQRDMITDLTIAAQDMENQSRYTQDRDFIREFQVQYPPYQYTYLLTGHSLGGAICDQLMKDGIGVQAITFNPAVQKAFYDSQNNKRIYQADDPLYRMMGRYCKYNVEVRTNRQQGAIEQALSYVPIAGVGYTALQAHSLDNYVGGTLFEDLPPDAMTEIMHQMDVKDAAKLGATSKKMQDVFKNSVYGKHPNYRGFTIVPIEGADGSARKKMRVNYKTPDGKTYEFIATDNHDLGVKMAKLFQTLKKPYNTLAIQEAGPILRSITMRDFQSGWDDLFSDEEDGHPAAAAAAAPQRRIFPFDFMNSSSDDSWIDLEDSDSEGRGRFNNMSTSIEDRPHLRTLVRPY